MFVSLAPKLRDMGWKCLIPLHNPGKRPIENGWEAYSQSEPTDCEINQWGKRYPGAGIGLVSGPDGIIAVDLDFRDPAKSARALNIADETLGTTPLVRVGQAPKSMLFYRAAGGLDPGGRAFGGYELYRHSGQVVLYSVHPDTRQPYRWTEARPEDVSPSGLPVISQSMLDAFKTEMEPLCETTKRFCDKGDSRLGGASGASVTGKVLSLMNRAEEDPLKIAADCVSDAAEGSRHYAMVGAVTALVMKGYTSAEIRAALEPTYFETLNASEIRARYGAVAKAVQWAIQRTRDGEDSPVQYDATSLTAAWLARK
jgi:hypothetical protein